MTDNEKELLSALLIFCEHHHPFYRKEAKRLWWKLCAPKLFHMETSDAFPTAFGKKQTELSI